MDGVFVYWDDSNLFHEARRRAEERAEELQDGPDARYRVRIHFENLLRLAQADRPLVRAAAAGSVPPELRRLWNRLEGLGAEVTLGERGEAARSDQEASGGFLQLRMLEDALDHNADPGIAVLLTGDGAGCREGQGFHRTLERMRRKGWRFEILSWTRACSPRMRRWAEEKGVFVPLDDFYPSITFTVPSREGQESARPRYATPVDLSRRPLS